MPIGNAPTTSKWSAMLLPTTMHLILELWGYFINLNINLIYEKDNCIDIVRGPNLQLTDTNHWNPVKSKSTNNVTYHKNCLSQHRRKLISGAVLASVPDSDKQLLVWTGSSASEATKQTRNFNLVDVLSICIYNNRKCKLFITCTDDIFNIHMQDLYKTSLISDHPSFSSI